MLSIAILCLLCLATTLLSNPLENQILKSNVTEQEYNTLDTQYLENTDQVAKTHYLFENWINPQLKETKVFLDIGPGPGHITDPISKYFEKTTVMEPNSTYKSTLENLGYRTLIGNFENFPIEQYDFILCSHVLYYVERKDRDRFLEKIYHSLNKGGKALIVMQTTEGMLPQFQATINPLFGNSDQIETELKKLSIPYKIKKFPCHFKIEDFDTFHNVVKLFTLDDCFSPQEFNQFSDSQKSDIYQKIEHFSLSCLTTNGSYLITWEDAFILLEK